MNKIGELIKKVERLDTKPTLDEIEAQLDMYTSNAFLYDAEKVAKLTQAKELLLFENIKQKQTIKEFFYKELIKAFQIIMLENIISLSNEGYTKTDIFKNMVSDKNRDGYINYIQTTYDFKDFNYIDYLNAFTKAVKLTRAIYSDNLKREQEQLREQRQMEKLNRQRQKQSIINNIFVTGLFVALDRKLKKNN